VRVELGERGEGIGKRRKHAPLVFGILILDRCLFKFIRLFNVLVMNHLFDYSKQIAWYSSVELI
jgi:hypothetical protein